jgi:hypothetical protein
MLDWFGPSTPAEGKVHLLKNENSTLCGEYPPDLKLDTGMPINLDSEIGSEYDICNACSIIEEMAG